MRIAMLCVLSVTLSACGDLGQTQHTILGDELPGLGDFDTISKEDREQESWWDKFYGRKPSGDSGGASGGRMGGSTITPMGDTSGGGQ